MNKFLFLKTAFIILFIAICMRADAQNRMAWVVSMGSKANTADAGNAIVVDTAGNVYTTGRFNTTVDFDPGVGIVNLTAVGSEDVFVTKMNASGELIWARSWGGSHASGDAGVSIAVDADGNVYTTGYFGQKVDFNPSPAIEDTFFLTAQSIFRDAFISKLDSAGNFLWARRIGGASNDIGQGIVVNASGGVYTVGMFNGKVDFNPSTIVEDTFFLTSAGSSDVFISKLDASGNFVWARQMGGTLADSGNAIVMDLTGNIYTTGIFNGTADFDPGLGTSNLTSAGAADVFVSKLDPSGNFLWAKGMGGTGPDIATGIALDISGNILTTGIYAGTADFDPSTSSATHLIAKGAFDIFVSKLNPSGNFVWAKSMGGTGVDNSNAIALDLSGNVYTIGHFTGVADFDPGTPTFNFTPNFNGSSYSRETFISKLSSAGEFVWAIQNGGKTTAGSCNGNGIAVGRFNREVYATGSFIDTVNFNSKTDTIMLASTRVSTAPAAAPTPDIFIYKITQPSCRTYSTLAASACESYIFNGQTYTTSGTYTHMFTNAAGCDSSVILTVTIQNNTYGFSQIACDSFTLNRQTYKTSGIYTQTHTNAAGCDSVITLNLTIKYSSAKSLADTACSTYTLNGQTYTTTGIYTQTYTNAVGCDSIVTLDLTIDTPTSAKLVITACDSLILNGQTYATTAVYTQSFLNAKGCDSTLTIDLTIAETPTASIIKTGTTLTANTADTYKWMDCDNGNSVVAGATQKNFTPTKNGSYAVIVTGVGGCSDTSDCVTVTGIAGIDVIDNTIYLNVYPNPTTNAVTVKSDRELHDAVLTLTDIVGKVLGRYDFSGSLFRIDLARYIPGMYFLEVKEGTKIANIKVVKE